MKRMERKYKVVALPISLVVGFIFFCMWQTNTIVITKSDYANEKIPKAFNDFKIAHISDFHNKSFGKNQEAILAKLKNSAPDIIIVTGDLIDRRKYNLETAMTFVLGAREIAPVYYVSGNHEAWSGKFPLIKERLIEAGVQVLDDTEFVLTRGEHAITLLGVSDPDFRTSHYREGTDVSHLTKQLKQWSDAGNFKILLSHRPELFALYCENNMDLVFAGHAHGGQFRLPGIGGLIAPDQGLFPQYTSGRYDEKATTMFVSRGLGNSIMPLRIFNNPEIVVVTLKTQHE